MIRHLVLLADGVLVVAFVIMVAVVLDPNGFLAWVVTAATAGVLYGLLRLLFMRFVLRRDPASGVWNDD